MTPYEAERGRQVPQGDVEAFGVIEDRDSGRLRRYAFHLLRSRADADEVAHQALVRALRSLVRYEERNHLAWRQFA